MRDILVVEQDEERRQAIQLALRAAGREGQGVGDAAAAARALEAEPFAAVVAPADGTGFAALLARARLTRPPAVVIATVGAGEEAAGLAALRAGAADYLARPASAEALLAAVEKAAARAEAGARAVTPPPVTIAAPAAVLADMIGDAPAMRALKATIAKVAPHKATVLIRGESGTGKEVVARALHRLSPWGGGPFQAINCGAIPAGLLESELFGHRKGAFTDAVRDRAGLVEQAGGGTLFLDEIGELPPPLQVKLLRVLQDQRVRRLGDEADVVVDVRVVAATARPLEAEVAAGRFREDLLYRLDVVTLRLPPLRDRAEDIPALAAHFLTRARARLGTGVTSVSREALRLLEAYRWPGNVRELENVIEHAAVLCEAEAIDAASLPERLRAAGDVEAGAHDSGAPGTADRADHRADDRVTGAAADPAADLSIRRSARRAEEALIRRALSRTGGNRTRAAELLEISHRALLYKIKEYGISD